MTKEQEKKLNQSLVDWWETKEVERQAELEAGQECTCEQPPWGPCVCE